MSSLPLEPIRDVEDSRVSGAVKSDTRVPDVVLNAPPSFFVPSIYTHVIELQCRLDDNWSGDVSVVYKLNFFQKIFVLLEHESSCRLGFIISVLMAGAVLINVIGFIVSAEMTSIPLSCSAPVCDNDLVLCPGRQICEPVSPDVFGGMDNACIYIFTIDYVLRMLTCWTVSPRLASLTTDALDHRSKPWQLICYFFNFKNVIDCVSILPFYIFVIMYGDINQQVSGFVRVLRIPRILRVLNISKRFQAVNVIVEILTMTLSKASNALFFTFFFVCLSTLVFSSIMYILEQGVYVVNKQYPLGAYVREDIYGTKRNEITPFTDISVSMYYVIVTLTTLGYGDEGMFVPTSPGGRALACLLCFSGILVLALPIAVIGNNFVELYRRYIEKMENVGKMSWSDMKRTKLRAAVGVNVADPSLLDKLDLCVQHEKCCTDITAKAILTSDRAARQSEELKKVFFEVQSVIPMVLYEVQVRQSARAKEKERKRLEMVHLKIQEQQEQNRARKSSPYSVRQTKNGDKGSVVGGMSEAKSEGARGGSPGSVMADGLDASHVVTGTRPGEWGAEAGAGAGAGGLNRPPALSFYNENLLPRGAQSDGRLEEDAAPYDLQLGRSYDTRDVHSTSAYGNDDPFQGAGSRTKSRKATVAELVAHWPLITPSVFVYVKTRQDLFFPYRVYQLNSLQRLFVFFEHPKSSRISTLCFCVLMVTIVVGVVSLVLQTDPDYMYRPSTCDSPGCNNDPELCPGIQICPPVPYEAFSLLDDVVVYIFTIDYVVRVCLCGFVPRRLADVMPDDWDEMELQEANMESRAPREEPPPVAMWYQMYCYLVQVPNLIDLIAIAPYYIALSYRGPLLSFFRVLRLTRILAVTKISGSSDYAQVLTRTMRKSCGVLIPLSFAVTLILVLYACLIFVVEQGQFTVTTAYPSGAYMRKTVAQNAMDISPFTSISKAMYYVVVTLTTVGYGDMVPTSVGGRALACLFAYTGIVVWTFPIAIIGKNFIDEFKDMMDFERERCESAKFAQEEPEGFPPRESGLLKALEMLQRASKMVKISLDESAEISEFVENLAQNGRDASVTAEVLRQVVAPAQDWLEHY